VAASYHVADNLSVGLFGCDRAGRGIAASFCLWTIKRRATRSNTAGIVTVFEIGRTGSIPGILAETQ
jgi:hypothetical protein